jgi:hypothetical protein
MAQERRGFFTERLEIRRPPDGLIYQDAPEPLRNAFLNLLHELGSFLPDWEELYRVFESALDKWTPDTRYVTNLNTIGGLVKTCEWHEFYDLVETTVNLLATFDAVQANFVNRFNAALCRHYLGYELRDGRIELVGAREAEIAIAEARAILRDPDLAGPDDQFQKAIGFFNRRPEPDVENCVKDAVGAVEALAGILLKDPSILLSKALIRIGQEKGVAATLCKLMGDLYAYRGDAPGAAHGKTSAKPPIRVEDAELVLHTSAACIVYLARLYGKAVE